MTELNKKTATHDKITHDNLLEWGYIQHNESNSYINWNGMWVRKVNETWEYGNPNHHTIDSEHPFIKKGTVEYLDELEKLQPNRGLEYKKYK